MEKQIDKMLGGNGDLTRLHDGVTLYSRLPDAIKGDGSEEKF